MRSNLRTSRFKAIVLLSFLSVAPAFASDVAAREPADEPRIEFEQTIHDFGVVGQNTTVNHEFAFHNAGDSILQIESIESPCSCTASLLSSDSIAPGETGILEVAFSAGMRQGTSKNSLTMYTNDSASPEVKIEITAEVEPLFAVEPHFLVFDVGAGEKEKIVRVSRLNERAPPIKAVKTSADLLIARFEDMTDITLPIDIGETATYIRVQLANMDVETPREESIFLSLEYPPGAVYHLPVLLRRVYRVSIMPPVAALGIVKQGKKAGKILKVIGDDSTDMERLKISATPEIISATLQKTDSVNEVACRVEIKETAPAGFVSGEITVTVGEDGPVVAKAPVFALIED